MSKTFIANPEIRLVLSNKIIPRIKQLKENAPSQKNSSSSVVFTDRELDLLKKVNELKLESKENKKEKLSQKDKTSSLTLPEVKKLKQTLEDRYLCDIIESASIKLPENEVVERNPELEKRIQKLKALQEQKVYNSMTKNVDHAKKFEPTETISYQLKQINRQLIAVAQFVFSVISGFFFGFLGVELIVGNLDFGFRLLLGIICALVIALAEIYFLAKKLNEEMPQESPTITTSPDKKKN
ncbi:CLUMA_CG005533, isoform A [Clunio marinus]|uniref:CLUMA_CG005533, isoform A n=1 Tax=Clunio marinus TaxID=568069 RepID=A0A1J1HWK0_9DIPT|nr:CLUMA_CG005533, isoform A [Clunio marinus]